MNRRGCSELRRIPLVMMRNHLNHSLGFSTEESLLARRAEEGQGLLLSPGTLRTYPLDENRAAFENFLGWREPCDGGEH